MRTPTAKQQAILDAITAYHAAHGYPPTLRELQDACAISSTSVLAFHLDRMEGFGWLEREPGKPRSLRVQVENIPPGTGAAD